jgi:hypothetical protein
MIETEHAKTSRHLPCSTQHRHHVCGGSKPDIPKDKLPGRFLHPFGDAQLIQVKGFSFSHRPDHRMKRLAMSERMEAERAIRQPHQFVSCLGSGCVMVRHGVDVGPFRVLIQFGSADEHPKKVDTDSRSHCGKPLPNSSAAARCPPFRVFVCLGRRLRPCDRPPTCPLI